MKLLLTSNGLMNDSIKNALEELVGKPRKEIKIAFIPTAGLAPGFSTAGEDRAWLANDIYNAKEFGGYIDIISLSDLPKEDLYTRLEFADVIFVGGGNTFYLSYWMEKSGLFDALPELLKTRVYAGISAGSMMATASILTASRSATEPEVFRNRELEKLVPGGFAALESAGLVDFCLRPHYKRPTAKYEELDKLIPAIQKELQLPLYAIDDQTAIKVVDGQVEVVSEGQWKLYE